MAGVNQCGPGKAVTSRFLQQHHFTQLRIILIYFYFLNSIQENLSTLMDSQTQSCGSSLVIFFYYHLFPLNLNEGLPVVVKQNYFSFFPFCLPNYKQKGKKEFKDGRRCEVAPCLVKTSGQEVVPLTVDKALFTSRVDPLPSFPCF